MSGPEDGPDVPDAVGDDAGPPPGETFGAKRKKKKLPLTLIKVVISGLLIAWTVKNAEFGKVIDAMKGAKLPWLLAAFSLVFVGSLVTATRWRGLLAAHGHRMSVFYLFQSCVVARFVGQFLPTTIGGDALRGWDTWRAGTPKALSLAILVIDRLVGFLALICFALGALMFSPALNERFPLLRPWVVLGTACLLFGTWIVFFPTPRLMSFVNGILDRFPKKLRSPFEKVLRALTSFQGKTGQLGRAFVLSVLLQVNVVTFYWLIAQSLSLPIDYADFYLIVPIFLFIMLVPVSINGIGVREAACVALLTAYAGVEQAQAVAFAWLEYLLFLSYGLLGGVVYAFRKEGAPEPDPA
ncbi:MAG: lysylphosphatidylglycerol synthase transmembrane domain-containing protein [Acidobacteriota bacterium]